MKKVIIPAIFALAITACSGPSNSPDPVATESESETAIDTPPYSRYTLTKQSKIVEKKESGETLTADETQFLENHPVIEEE